MNKEITDGNKLIAEFMGWKENESGYYPHPQYEYNYKGEIIESSMGNYKGDKPLYMLHKSWDWLIPVIEKIESLAFQVVMTKPIAGWSICTIKSEKLNYTEEQAASVKINSVHKAVINFIKWYNEQNKKNN